MSKMWLSWKRPMSNWLRLFRETRLRSSKRLRNGEASIMSWIDNLLISTMPMIETRLFGKASLSSLNSRETQPRRILKMLRRSSKPPSRHYKKPKTIANIRVRALTAWWWVSLNRSSNRESRNSKRIHLHFLLISSRRTSNWKERINY
jgi:hypothetical protein